jgi:hypothetical protein
MKLLHLNLDQAIYCFFYGILLLSIIISIWGFCKIYKSMSARIIAIGGVLLSLFLPLRINDVYIISSCCSLMIIPWMLYFFYKDTLQNNFCLLAALCAGLIIGFSNYIRAYTGFGPLLFCLVLLPWMPKWSFSKKIISLVLIVLGMLLPSLYIKQQCTKYQNYAQKEFVCVPSFAKAHMLWFTIYAGFGFLYCMNTPNIQWNDGCVDKKIKSINPSIDFCEIAREQAPELQKNLSCFARVSCSSICFS